MLFNKNKIIDTFCLISFKTKCFFFLNGSTEILNVCAFKNPRVFSRLNKHNFINVIVLQQLNDKLIHFAFTN